MGATVKLLSLGCLQLLIQGAISISLTVSANGVLASSALKQVRDSEALSARTVMGLIFCPLRTDTKVAIPERRASASSAARVKVPALLLCGAS